MTRQTHRLAAITLAITACPGGPENKLLAGAVANAWAMTPDQIELHADPQNPDSGWLEHRLQSHGAIWAVLAAFLVALAVPAPWTVPAVVGTFLGILQHTATDGMTLGGSGIGWPLYRHGQSTKRQMMWVLPERLRLRVGARPERWGVWPSVTASLYLIAGPAVTGAGVAVAFHDHPRVLAAYRFVLRVLRAIRRSLFRLLPWLRPIRF